VGPTNQGSVSNRGGQLPRLDSVCTFLRMINHKASLTDFPGRGVFHAGFFLKSGGPAGPPPLPGGGVTPRALLGPAEGGWGGSRPDPPDLKKKPGSTPSSPAGPRSPSLSVRQIPAWDRCSVKGRSADAPLPPCPVGAKGTFPNPPQCTFSKQIISYHPRGFFKISNKTECHLFLPCSPPAKKLLDSYI